MPIETTTTGLGADRLIASGPSSYLQAILASPIDNNFRNHPALINLSRPGQFVGTQGSAKISLQDLEGSTRLTQVAEGAQIVPSAISSAAAQITVANYGGGDAHTDEMRGRDPHGTLNPMMLAMKGFNQAQRTLVFNIAALAGSASVTIGSTGQSNSHDYFMAALDTLEVAGVPGPYVALWGPKQFTDWRTDLEARGGSTQWRPATVQMQMLMGGSMYKGRYNNVDIYVAAEVESDGTDYTGMLWGRGAIGFAEETIAPSQFANVVANAGPIVVEAERTVSGRYDAIYTNYRHGVVIIEAGRMVDYQTRQA